MQNQAPTQISAQLISENKSQKSNSEILASVTIQAKGDHDRGYAPEIISIKENKVDGNWEIEVRWKTLQEKLNLDTEAIKTLIPEITHEETANRLAEEINDWWMAIDEELVRPRINSAFAERQQQLGSSVIEKRYWNLSPLLNEKQEAVLCYFLPYVEQIKNDVKEMAYCFSTFLNRPVEVERIPANKARPTFQKSKALHHWQIGLNSLVGGWGDAKEDEIKINISGTNDKELKTFLPGSPQRLLIEQILIPAFVDHKLNWQIELKMTSEKAFVIKETNTIGINFFKVSA